MFVVYQVMIMLGLCGMFKAMMYSQRCKWSNDACSSDAECCSGTCDLLHPGTNHRCASSSMRQPCLSDFHCDGRLKCGLKYVCCAGHWGTCSESEDCCESHHVCRKKKGFIYNKCLPPPSTLLLPKSSAPTSDKLVLSRFRVATIYTVLFLLGNSVTRILSVT